jgi:L-rhamnose mutarotase
MPAGAGSANRSGRFGLLRCELRGPSGRPAFTLAGASPMKRYGLVLRVRPEKEQEYRRYHEAVWPEILDIIRNANIRNYSIYLKDHYLFAYYEYVGDDHAADMAKLAAEPKMREWWDVMEPMQDPLPTRKKGEWWAEMEEVFHTD